MPLALVLVDEVVLISLIAAGLIRVRKKSTKTSTEVQNNEVKVTIG